MEFPFKIVAHGPPYGDGFDKTGAKAGIVEKNIPNLGTGVWAAAGVGMLLPQHE